MKNISRDIVVVLVVVFGFVVTAMILKDRKKETQGTGGVPAEMQAVQVQEIVERTPRALNAQGVEYGKAGDLDKAISLFQEAAEADPNYAESYNNLGFAYYTKGDLDRAIEYFNKTLEVDPTHGRAKLNLERARKIKESFEVDQRYVPGEEDLTEGEAVTVEEGLEPSQYAVESPEALNMMGVEAGKAGDLDKAISLFQEAVEVDPDYAESYNNLGFAYYKKGDNVLAEEYFKKTLEVDPDHERAKLNLERIKQLK